MTEPTQELLKERTDIAFETGRIYGLREAYDILDNITWITSEIDIAMNDILRLINKKETDKC